VSARAAAGNGADGADGADAQSVEFCGLRLAHRVINGSGTFDAIAARVAFGQALEREFPFAAYVSKTITLRPRNGNPPPRLWEAAGGLINSIGLPNKGLQDYLAEDLPRLVGLSARVPGEAGERLPVPLITNVMGSSAEEFTALVSACEQRAEISALELNVSCPNVETGLDIGADPDQLRAVVGACRASTAKPLIVKLTPNTADVPACALAAQDGGADAVSLINTLRAMALAPSGGVNVRGPRAPADGAAPRWLGGGTGGLSGPAIRAVALAQVGAVAERVSIPVVGMGGVQRAAHARELLDAGAELVAVGTETFRDPATAARIAGELRS
jgi:dihydroorotate dehydrogenase (NAD+) catalytic subunit